jgi:hypothetical protein
MLAARAVSADVARRSGDISMCAPLASIDEWSCDCARARPAMSTTRPHVLTAMSFRANDDIKTSSGRLSRAHC